MRSSRRKFVKGSLATGISLALAGRGVLAQGGELVQNTIPSSGETLPAIGLGTNRYGVGQSASARAPLKAALARFHALGGTLIDTAPMYRSSELVLGDLIAELVIRDDLFIATKIDRTGGAEQNHEQIHDSMDKLRTKNLELLQIHNLRGWRQSLPLMRELKEAGRLKYIGMTTSHSSQYKDLERIISNEKLDFIQLNYSLEQRESANRLLPLAADRGIAVIVNRPFGGGRIFDKVGNEPLPEWAQAFDCESWAQFLLKFAISHPAVTAAIPGMTKAHHVDDNIGAARGRLPTATEREQQQAFFDAL